MYLYISFCLSIDIYDFMFYWLAAFILMLYYLLPGNQTLPLCISFCYISLNFLLDRCHSANLLLEAQCPAGFPSSQDT